MRLLIIFFFIFSSNVFGQLSQCDILKNASISFCNNDYETSLYYLLDFRQKFAEHALIDEVNQQIGHLYYLKTDFEIAKQELNVFTDTTFKARNKDEYDALECPTNYDSSAFQCMRIVFPELYVNLQHYSCIDLYDIYKKEKQYDKALKYLILADSKYSYIGDCSIDLDNHDIELVLYFKEIYLLKNDTNSAIKAMVRGLFKHGSDSVYNSLKYFANKKYTLNQKAAEIEKAKKSFRQREFIGEEHIYKLYEMTLFDQTIIIPTDMINYYKIKSIEEIRALFTNKIKIFNDL